MFTSAGMTSALFPYRQTSVGKQVITSRLLGDHGIGAGGINYNNLIVEWPQVIKGNLHFNHLFKMLSHLHSGVPISISRDLVKSYYGQDALFCI